MAIMCGVKCCMWCFEKILKFISKNAVIVCAMYGTNFCSSACTAARLCGVNPFGTTEMITNLMLNFGVLSLSLANTLLAFVMYAPPKDPTPDQVT